ncbi:hypothetical protein RHMOL_Rhmol07G0249700 [Rhododendron molle]|uniref:Uncharacterized protein n=1 Tax=Rhododendron molle TaxID=49168 RepID=A0ACC0N5Y9_RHOML|nr:hypothetical protein RHMOL_Rhmol07G0249700 [Rhododendron molle]
MATAGSHRQSNHSRRLKSNAEEGDKFRRLVLKFQALDMLGRNAGCGVQIVQAPYDIAWALEILWTQLFFEFKIGSQCPGERSSKAGAQKHPRDTKVNLFICGGAFIDLEKTISERTVKTSFGVVWLRVGSKSFGHGFFSSSMLFSAFCGRIQRHFERFWSMQPLSVTLGVDMVADISHSHIGSCNESINCAAMLMVSPRNDKDLYRSNRTCHNLEQVAAIPKVPQKILKAYSASSL